MNSQMSLSSFFSNIIDPGIWKKLWHISILEKVKHFLWRAYLNALSTRANLAIKRISQTGICPVCLMAPETSQHMLLCPWIEPIWFGLNCCPVPSPYSINRFLDWLGNSILSASTKYQHNNVSIIYYALWNIWKPRNEKVHNDRNPFPMAITITSRSQCLRLLRSKKDCVVNPPNGRPIYTMKGWRPPRDTCIKIKCDAQFDCHSGRSNAIVICRNSKGEVLTRATVFLRPRRLLLKRLGLYLPFNLPPFWILKKL